MGDERLRALAEVISEGFMELRDGCLARSNPQLARISGRGGASLAGLKVRDLFCSEDGGLPGPRAPDTLECTLQTGDGRRRAVICRRVPGWASGEDAEGWLVDDVTERRDVERELLRAGQDLARSNRELEAARERLCQERREREELLVLVSHELRTPLTVIRGYTKLLLDEEVGPLTEEQRRFLSESHKSSERLAGFIANILDAARLERPTDVLEITNEPIEGVIEDVARMFEPLFEEAGLRLCVDLELGLAVRFDRLRLEQILSNLLDNARRHVPRGGRVELTLRGVLEGERPVAQISVADDGPGIPEEERVHVFDPYVQLTEGERQGGLGLGLSICRRLVVAHGGEMRLDATPAGGARFEFTLPRSEATPTAVPLEDDSCAME